MRLDLVELEEIEREEIPKRLLELKKGKVWMCVDRSKRLMPFEGVRRAADGYKSRARLPSSSTPYMNS